MLRASIDPGKHGCARAYSHHDQIFGVDFGPPVYYREADLWHVDELWCEVPVVYPGIRKEDPNDLIRVSRGLGKAELSIVAKRTIDLAPRDWKGSLDKDLMLRRIEKLLRPEELALVDRLKLPKKTRHNAIDACGILLHAMGRLSY